MLSCSRCLRVPSTSTRTLQHLQPCQHYLHTSRPAHLPPQNGKNVTDELYSLLGISGSPKKGKREQPASGANKWAKPADFGARRDERRGTGATRSTERPDRAEGSSRGKGRRGGPDNQKLVAGGIREKLRAIRSSERESWAESSKKSQGAKAEVDDAPVPVSEEAAPAFLSVDPSAVKGEDEEGSSGGFSRSVGRRHEPHGPGHGKGKKNSHRGSVLHAQEAEQDVQRGKQSRKVDHDHIHKTRLHSPAALLSSREYNPNFKEADVERSKPKAKPAVKKEPKPAVEKEVYIPSSVRVSDLARIVDDKLGRLQRKMRDLGIAEEQCHSDHRLTSEDAGLIAMEYGLNPIVDEQKSFDIYPDEVESDYASLPLRPPVVTIMGHVDHGKTTLLDSLRHTSVASGEAGGITQHIGAFSVPIAGMLGNIPADGSVEDGSGIKSITFLDTPGHAAFTGMRARGASVTDLVVLVVAADDGVMPQTKEVLELVQKTGVGMVVAINKCDKPGIDFQRVKSALGAEQIHLEEDGGDVPSVKVSGLRGDGLDTLVETLGALAEVRDLRARSEGRAEGWVIESRVEKGRGNVATVLVTRGTMKVGSVIIAGNTWCKVRQMTNDRSQIIKSASPGQPVIVTGWRDLPSAGDQLLQPYSDGSKGEDEVKQALANRLREKERKALLADAEVINKKRAEERERQEAEEMKLEAIKAEGGDVNAALRMEERKVKAEEAERNEKELRLLVRADVSGTVEAVVGALEGIGNGEVGTKIIFSGVGDVTEADVAMAEASDATVIGFSVGASRTVENLASTQSVPLHLESVIYRLIETVRNRVAGLLPPIIETRVTGEATVQQIFTIAIKGSKEGQVVAGCRIGNGLIGKNDLIRVLRGSEREVVFEGKIESLKHLKKEINEARKGSECGISLEGYRELKEGDQIVSVQKTERLQDL